MLFRSHVDKTVDPVRDIETINLELIFSDMEVLERRLSKSRKASKADKTLAAEVAVLEKVYAVLENGQPARMLLGEDAAQDALIRTLGLISANPVLYASNVSEDDLVAGDNAYVTKVREYAAQEGSEVFVICAQIEQELADLDEEEKTVF